MRLHLHFAVAVSAVLTTVRGAFRSLHLALYNLNECFRSVLALY
jgi:hypothetical protein